MQKLFNIFSVMSISIIGLYFYSTTTKVSNDFLPVNHIDCIEEPSFVFGDSFSKSF
tara:strand:+ start:19 stop:186 length:168 start_codon:yes stop_codon:yes gene_type:complete